MILLACVLGLVWGLLRNGHLDSIFKKKFRLPALLFISLAMEFLLSSSLFRDKAGAAAWYPALRTILAITQYLLLAIFLYRNRFKPGVLLLLAGSLTNGLVICANSGKMPVGPRALDFGAAAAANISAAPHYFLAAGSEPLLILSDILPIPLWIFGSYMISLGDILIMAGIFRLAAYMPRRILRPRPKAVEHQDNIGYTEGR